MPRKTHPDDNGSGSPTGEPVYLIVGFIRRPHGIHGELIMDIHTEFPERLGPGLKVYLGEKHQAMEFASTRLHGKAMLVSFRSLDSPEKAGYLRNSWVYVTAADRPTLPDDGVYQHQILGMRVVTDNDQELGKLVDIFDTGANSVYVVRTPKEKDILLPAIPDVILDINLHKGEIRIHLIEGLVD